jgi:hypothetical protein
MGGKDNFAIDRQAAPCAMAANPGLASAPAAEYNRGKVRLPSSVQPIAKGRSGPMTATAIAGIRRVAGF